MTYYAFIQDNKINGAGQCPCLNEEIQNIEISEEVFNAIIEDKDRYIWDGTNVVVNPDYEEIKANERKAEFESKFIQTSWGWYRKQPKGYANAPQSIDIIFNIVNASGGFTEQVADMMLFYQQPDFDNPEECTEEWLVEHQYKHEPCSIQEFLQFYIAFQTAWANDQYKSSGETSDVDT